MGQFYAPHFAPVGHFYALISICQKNPFPPRQTAVRRCKPASGDPSPWHLGRLIQRPSCRGFHQAPARRPGHRTPSPSHREETAMHYKTIVLELLQDQYPTLHEQLRRQPDAAPGGERLRLRPETPPRVLEDRVPPGQPGPRPGPDREHRPGNGDRGPPGRFTPESSTDETDAVFPRRGDSLHPLTHAARVTSTRPASGQSLLPLRPGRRHLLAPGEPGRSPLSPRPCSLLLRPRPGPWTTAR